MDKRIKKAEDGYFVKKCNHDERHTCPVHIDVVVNILTKSTGIYSDNFSSICKNVHSIPGDCPLMKQVYDDMITNGIKKLSMASSIGIDYDEATEHIIESKARSGISIPQPIIERLYMMSTSIDLEMDSDPPTEESPLHFKYTIAVD